jgi:divalent metal cation (Fe/Co/Zn/Cd) transporter
VVGFLGNEIVARYRIRVGRQIGSAALVADGLHARTDGFTSLAVLLGAGGVAVGWSWADPVVGLLITVAILGVLRSAIRQVGALWTPTWWITRRRDQHRAGRHRG